MNAREQARNAMKRAWTIRKAAAAACGCKVSEPDGRLLKIKNIPKNI